MPAKIKTAVLGATGYSGYELARLLLRHPRLEKPLLFRRPSENGDGGDLAKLFPALSGNGGFPLQPFSWEALTEVDLLFLATPHDVSRALAPGAVARGIRVIDLSGAWRLKQPQHRSVYGFHDSDAAAAEELTDKAVYGLPELNGEQIREASLVANPGCYATSVILALAPLLAANVIGREKGIISDSKSGVSGAGKEPTSRTHFVSVADNLSAYSVFGHRRSRAVGPHDDALYGRHRGRIERAVAGARRHRRANGHRAAIAHHSRDEPHGREPIARAGQPG